ncbi:MAG: OmpA family protein [Desulfobacteraceae bacterium]|nr:MAG: OmpA family protein [Desulfobacteraceae bacterium]
MKQHFSRWLNAVAIVIALMLWGCAGAPLAVDPIDPGQNPQDAIEELGRQIERAGHNQVDVLSPTWFQRARSTYARARQDVESNAPPEEILKNIAIARAELQQAEVVAIRSRDQLAEAIESRNAARSVHAQQFGREYDEVESDFLKLTRAMEDNEFEYARKRSPKVVEAYRALELRAIDQAALGDVRELLQNAADAKVPQMAPKTFLEAQETFRQAENFIVANRYDRAGIKEHSDRARFLARRSLVIAATGRRLQQMTPEDIALWMETFLFQTTSRLQTQDQRNTSFEEQQDHILSTVDGILSELTLARKSVEDKNLLIQKMTGRLAEMEGEAQQVMLEHQRLAVENRFNELFFQVQGYFQAQEADVIRQSDQMIIRLKGLRFPVGGASLQQADQELLNKVQRAILTFGAPEVIIEGHTDNTGAPEKNRALSKQRAESVKQFLAQRYTLPLEKIATVGHGDTRPIASNETSEGRVQNRRIDVIIQPSRTESP